MILEHWHNTNVTALSVYLWDDSLKPSTPENDSRLELWIEFWKSNDRFFSKCTKQLYLNSIRISNGNVDLDRRDIVAVSDLHRGFASRRKFNFSFSA